MTFSVLTATLSPHANGFDNVEDAMNAAVSTTGTSPFSVAVVIDTEEESGAVAVAHDGFVYLGDSAPALTE